MKQKECIFCNIEEDKVLLKNKSGYVINDKFPHSKGHVLIIPYEHSLNYFELTKEDQLALSDLLIEAKSYCDKNYDPAGYNVQMNIGKAAGQIIMHTHIHLIPRYD